MNSKRKKKRFKGFFIPLLAFALLVLGIVSMTVQSVIAAPNGSEASVEAGPAVVIVPVKQKVEQGLHSFLKRAFREANEARAEHIVLIVNTFGGRVDSASEIGQLIRSSSIPTTAFIEGKAVSAGTYIALNANQIAMQPGSIIGAAAVVDGGGRLIEDPKTVSFWVGQMSEAAKMNGRDPAIAAAMVDINATVSLETEIGRDKKKGEILSLTASEANIVGYSDYTANSMQEVVAWLGLDNRMLVEIKPTFAEEAARFFVNPIVTTILLIFGISGIAIELLVPGFGVPGIAGMLSFGFYFFGSFISGLSGMESVVLFVIGIILLALELFVPSFGILGLLGSLALITGVVIAAPDPKTGLISLSVALAAATVIVVWFARTQKGRGVWNRFILRDRLTTEEGYLSAEVKSSLVGQFGVTLTPLRPSGTVQLGEDRLDVVTSGEFISAGRTVVVIRTEGTWIVVKETVSES